MRAIRCKEYGEPRTLVLEEAAALRPGPGEVVVRIAAAAVNFPDALIVANRYQIPVPVPFTPGSDFAGTVVAVGEGSSPWREGDRVFGSVFTGAYAEEVVASAGSLQEVPAEVEWVHAAAFPTVYGTAYDAVRTTAAVESGQTMAVLGAAGGVGSAAVATGKLLGARVIACVSTQHKARAALEVGADEVIVYSAESLKSRLKELAPGGVDAVIDPVGGALAEEALRATRYGGRFVVVGFASGEIPRLPLNLVLLKGVIVKGYEIASFLTHETAAATRNRKEMREHLAAGRLLPYIGSRYPLSRAAEAMAEVAERRAIGKVILEP